MKTDDKRDPRENNPIWRWAFWSVFYFFAKPFRRESTIEQWMTRSMRTMSPWWKWKPAMWRNEDGRQWEVCFENEGGVDSDETIRVRVTRAWDGRRIVGMTVYDESLKPRIKEKAS